MNDNLDARLRRVVNNRKQEAVRVEARRKEETRDRLIRLVTKKLQTGFIGALARFEDFFGRLWGQGKDASECTERELEFRKRWDECRTSVLDNGNNQVRAVESELSRYDVAWNRYHTAMKVKKSE